MKSIKHNPHEVTQQILPNWASTMAFNRGGLIDPPSTLTGECGMPTQVGLILGLFSTN